jgi:hypothetical protein
LGPGSRFAFAPLDRFFSRSARFDRSAPADAFETDPEGVPLGTPAAQYSGEGSLSTLKRSRSLFGARRPPGCTLMPNARRSRRTPSVKTVSRSGDESSPAAAAPLSSSRPSRGSWRSVPPRVGLVSVVGVYSSVGVCATAFWLARRAHDAASATTTDRTPHQERRKLM